jgi:hypothetical protein
MSSNSFEIDKHAVRHQRWDQEFSIWSNPALTGRDDPDSEALLT